MKTAMIIRSIVLAMALVNQTLVLSGFSPLPFEDAQVENAVTAIFTVAAAIWSWWKNNNVTRAAREAQLKLDRLKNQ